MAISEERRSEIEIINAAKKDHRQFAVLYEKYFEQIFRFVLKRTGNKELCSDLTSQVFLKAMLSIGKYQDRGYPFSSWLYRIAINEVNMFYRKKSKVVTVEIKEKDAFELFSELDEKLEDEERINRILAVLGTFKSEYQQLIELRYFEHKSFKEIGEILNISEGNAKIRTYRVLDKLKKVLRK